MARATTEDMASMTAADRESARTDRPIDPRSTSHSRIRGLAFLIAALAPALAAIWAVPWFVTQDAPAHVYNAEILARSFDPTSPFGAFFAIRWQPIPNWVGHVVLAGLVRVFPAWAADRIMTSVTLAGFAAVGLLAAPPGRRVADRRGFRVRRRRPASAGGCAAGGAAGHEHHLAAGLHQLHARCLPVPDHAGVLVAAPRPPGGPRRPRAVGALDPGLLLSPGQPGTDRDRPGRAGAGDPAAALHRPATPGDPLATPPHAAGAAGGWRSCR